MADNTIVSYCHSLKQYLEMYENVFTKKNLLSYKGFLIENYSPKTVNLRILAINKYLEFNKLDKLKLKMIKVQQRTYLENVISDADYKFFKNKLKKDGRMNWYFIVRYLAATGARISELVQIKIEHVHKGYINANVISIFQVCGYEVNDSNPVQKAYRVFTGPNARIEEQATNTTQGAMWDGETLVLSKLIKRQILSPQIIDAENVNMTNPDGTSKIIEKAAILDYKNMNLVPEAPIAWQFMSLQDAVDFVRFAIETTINTMRFQSIDKTVGGPIDILIIKPGKTKWLQHKSLK